MAWWQKAEELAKKEHDQYRVKDSWEDDLYDYLEVGSNRQMGFVSNEALFSRLGLMTGSANRFHGERIRAIMSKLGYKTGFKRIEGKIKRGYSLTQDRHSIDTGEN
ncbi:MAG TPA: hypothetical protein ACHBZ9_17220 [Arsenophonus nasoniae]|uniref:hypothetical protein n=1 Tax=Arsenophonus nasoniae TaxID=638 RepID=UPI0038796902